MNLVKIINESVVNRIKIISLNISLGGWSKESSLIKVRNGYLFINSKGE